jgi:signal transduction histidine kinase
MTDHDSAATTDGSSARASTSLPLNERLAFLQLGDSDVERLHSLAPVYQSIADHFVATFFDHLCAFEETARFLQDSQRVERLKQAQRKHFQSLLAAKWDEVYVADRQRVGQAHAEVGLDPHLFLGGYSQFVQHFFRDCAAAHQGDMQELTEQLVSLAKVVFLDLSLTLDAYFSHLTRELKTALDLYWQANSDLRRFAQLASHDLKTPIATVANLCEEALDEFGDTMPTELRELITAARARTLKNSAMIDDLLESALSLDHETSQEEVSSAEVIEEILERLRPVINEKQIRVRVPTTLPVVWGNKVRLREAFYNLLSNATKFIDKTPGRIEITVEETGPRCIFAIEDNGPGIPAGDLQRIFVPFRRLAEHRDKPGSGLGLYFTLHLIERDGGQVWAESAPGDGSRFCVALQRLADED